jgi:acetyl/propionyl-CoA carboxylase alpha subunit
MGVGVARKSIKKVLIVNRSEVALRVHHACKALGMHTAVVYTRDDVGAAYVHAADQAYELAGCDATAYANQDEILAIAATAAVDAVHPGYGFLSENAQFATRVQAAGLIWIGPSPECMAFMGDKVQARAVAEAAGVSVVPGVVISLQDLDNLAQAQAGAAALGYPVIIKDPRSGGGRVMRKVHDAGELEAAWRALAAEATRVTGSCEFLLEKYLQRGRHVEVQIAGDGHQVIHLFERECSIQRRHQKMVEEAPCRFVPQVTLDRMYEAAVTLARAVKYQSVGTVEFMVVPDGTFYFLEMNTRLQVEHSVTEMTTGVDLVALQLELAQSGRLPYRQEDIRRHGHAIECRIYAEDPGNNFTPSTGVITQLQLPRGPWLRHDHDLEEGREITPFFDAMIAKLTTYGPTRTVAYGYMSDALRQYVIGGLRTNIPFLKRLLATEAFAAGAFDTQTLKDPFFVAQLSGPCAEAKGAQALAAVAVELVQALPSEPSEVEVPDTERPCTHASRAGQPGVQVPCVDGCVSRWKGQQWK